MTSKLGRTTFPRYSQSSSEARYYDPKPPVSDRCAGHGREANGAGLRPHCPVDAAPRTSLRHSQQNLQRAPGSGLKEVHPGEPYGRPNSPQRPKNEQTASACLIRHIWAFVAASTAPARVSAPRWRGFLSVAGSAALGSVRYWVGLGKETPMALCASPRKPPCAQRPGAGPSVLRTGTPAPRHKRGPWPDSREIRHNRINQTSFQVARDGLNKLCF
jgi:hypothetical protein